MQLPKPIQERVAQGYSVILVEDSLFGPVCYLQHGNWIEKATRAMNPALGREYFFEEYDPMYYPSVPYSPGRGKPENAQAFWEACFIWQSKQVQP